MSSFDLAQLAQDGAATLVSAMATDLWGSVRGRLERIFSHGQETEAHAAIDQVDAMRAIIAANHSANEEVELRAELKGFLRGYLADRPDVVPQFAQYLTALQEQVRPQRNITIRQAAKASHGSTIVQAGRDVVSEPKW